MMSVSVKRLLSLLISLIFCAFSSAGSLAAGGNAQFVYSPAFSGGYGAEDDPYLISCADDLYELALLVNSGEGFSGSRFLLTADIDLGGESFEPIGSGAQGENGALYAFRGSFSGGGRSITGLNAEAAGEGSFAGLFGVTEGAEIADLTVCGSVRGNARAGGTVAYALDTVLLRVRFEGEVEGLNGVGGVAGSLVGGSAEACSAYCTVTGERSVGGIAGGCERALIADCVSSVSVNGVEYAGGIAGVADSAEFRSDVSSGAVCSNVRLGGIVGFCFDSSLESCENRASVSGADRVGGAAGLALTTDFLDCTDLGTVSGERYVGGAAGVCCGCSFTSCVNRGIVSGSNYVGGLVGWSDDGADFGDSGLTNLFFSCMNSGAVEGEWGVGGLIGDAHDAKVSDCFSMGRVESLQYAGGLAGYSVECEYYRCYNAGSVLSEETAGAIVGKDLMNGSVFENCFYLDTCCENETGPGLPRSDAELMTPSCYTDYDLENVWTFPESGYPYASLVSCAPPLPLAGDSDGDGGITVADALGVLRMAMGILPVSSLDIFRSDTDGNGVIDVFDALTVLRTAMGVI